MKIRLSQIPQQGLQLTEDLDPFALDLQTEELTFTSPLHVKAEAHKILNTVSIKAEIKAETALLCGRCLEEFAGKFSEEYCFDYSVCPDDVFLDLEDDLRQEILLSYPLKLLCNPGCKGICVKCGKSLNKETCNCK
ncbi:MAG: DUF177 domain-containing protein [Candidatus Omnitrophota bacterium]|nr:DUF177 domain-containing protein [Candidatus Omnitrophota bacterium]